MEGPRASGLGLGSALWPGESCTSGRDRSTSTEQKQADQSQHQHVWSHTDERQTRAVGKLHTFALHNAITATCTHKYSMISPDAF